jgi:hypothetical protein
MAQTIKIKRGGIESLVNTTPTLAQGELLLATGSLNGLGSTFFVASASNSPSLPYAKIETIANGAALASSLDANFTGLLIHSASDNKLYRYNGSAFVELPIAAGSFVGILPVANGGTGVNVLDDIVGDAKIIVTNGTDSIIGGDVTLSLGGGVVSGSSQITYSGISGIPSGIVSGSSQITYSGISGIPSGIVSGSSQITYSGISGIPSGIVSGSSQIPPLLPSGTVSGSSQITYSGISGIPSGIVSGSSQITYSGISGIPSGIVSSSALAGGTVQGTLTLTTNNVSSGNITANGLGTLGTPTFAGLTITNGNVAINNGGSTALTTTGNTVAVFNTSANTVNAFGVATTLNIGSGSATTTLKGSTVNIGNTGDATATTINLGNSTNSATINIKGSLVVEGNTTTVNSTTVNIDDNIIVVNYGPGPAATAGIQAIDGTGTSTLTGSLIWDGNDTKDWWKAGTAGNEKRVVTYDDNTGASKISFVFTDADGYLDSIDVQTAPLTAGTLLQWNGSAMEASAIIDGGTF